MLKSCLYYTEMCDIKQLTVASEQRPTYTGSFRDAKITLHDEVFLDNDENEPKLNKILTLYQQAHCTFIRVVILRRVSVFSVSACTCTIYICSDDDYWAFFIASMHARFSHFSYSLHCIKDLIATLHAQFTYSLHTTIGQSAKFNSKNQLVL